jgi:hypothetical protein
MMADHPRQGGWFYMTARQCEDATALSAREQTAVRALLIGKGLLEEALAERPAKLHYKVNLDGVAKLLGLKVGGSQALASLMTLLQDCLRFYKPLADVTGSSSAGLYLSYLLHEQRASILGQSAMTRGLTASTGPFIARFVGRGEFIVNIQSARIALGLGIKTQRNARDRLKAAGLITESRSVQDNVTVSLNLAAISACLQAQNGKKLPASRRNGHGPASDSLASAKRKQAALALVSGPPELPASPHTPAHALRQQVTLFGAVLATVPATSGVASVGTADRTGLKGLAKLGSQAQVAALFAPGAALVVNAVVATPDQGTALVNVKPRLPVDNPADEFALLSKLGCPFVETGLPFCRNKEGIKDLKTTTTAGAKPSTVVAKQAGRRRIEDKKPNQDAQSGNSAQQSSQESSTTPLVMPTRLEPQWHQAVTMALGLVAASDRQVLLDELAGQLAIPNKTIHNPPGWLHGLIGRWKAGTAKLAMASSVRGDREQRERLLKAQEAAMQRPPQSEPAERQDKQKQAPSTSPEVIQARARLAEIRQSIVTAETARGQSGAEVGHG